MRNSVSQVGRWVLCKCWLLCQVYLTIVCSVHNDDMYLETSLPLALQTSPPCTWPPLLLSMIVLPFPFPSEEYDRLDGMVIGS